jgi:hypothetical protein
VSPREAAEVDCEDSLFSYYGSAGMEKEILKRFRMISEGVDAKFIDINSNNLATLVVVNNNISPNIGIHAFHLFHLDREDFSFFIIRNFIVFFVHKYFLTFDVSITVTILN